jgi:hypothetical protein
MPRKDCAARQDEGCGGAITVKMEPSLTVQIIFPL